MEMITKADLLDKAKALLEPLDEKRFQFKPHTTTEVVCWGDLTLTSLGELFISCSTDEVILISKNEFTRERDEHDLDPLAHFSTEEVSTIVNILETQLNQA